MSRFVHRNQKAGRDEDGLVVWDYHVILILHQGANSTAVVYDLDTRLPFPVSFPEYCRATFGDSEEAVMEKFHRKFRVVAGAEYLVTLSSDRRHMRQEEAWLAAPPPWPCIRGCRDSDHNLDTFINMEPGEERVGEVCDLETFLTKFWFWCKTLHLVPCTRENTLCIAPSFVTQSSTKFNKVKIYSLDRYCSGNIFIPNERINEFNTPDFLANRKES